MQDGLQRFCDATSSSQEGRMAVGASRKTEEGIRLDKQDSDVQQQERNKKSASPPAAHNQAGNQN